MAAHQTSCSDVVSTLRNIHEISYRDGWDKIIGLVTLAVDLSLKTVDACFAKILMNSAEGKELERRRRTNQTELTGPLGTVSDVLSRVIRELTKAGLIEEDQQYIRILDRTGLVKQAMIQGG